MRRGMFAVGISVAGIAVIVAGAVALGVPGGGAAPLSDERAVRNADIRFHANRAARDPLSAADRAQVAGLYLQRARETGNADDYGWAQAWAESSLAIRRDRNGKAQLVLASSLLARHRFPEALAAAGDLVSRDPEEPAYLGLLGELELEMGDYEEARRVFQSLDPWRTHLAVAPRLARWAEIEGYPDVARRLLNGALARALGQSDLPAEQLAWFSLRVGDFELRQGRFPAARSALERGLAAAPQDGRLLAAMARLEAAGRKWKRARRYAVEAVRLAADPATLSLLGDVEAALGHRAAAESAYAAVEALAAERPEPFNRQWTLHRLDHGRHLEETVALLRREIAVRRDVYGYDQLAWVLFRTGAVEAARAASDSALRMGTQDPMLFFHAGMIARAMGDSAAARRDLAHALELNPRFHHWFADTARAVLGTLEGKAPGGGPGGGGR
jgi:tetratricopeptide (TPR) repeat protein